MKTPLLICLLLAPLLVHAERADRAKAARIDAAGMEVDLNTGAKVLTGKVELRRGTLLITADKAVATQDAQGYDHVVLTAMPGGPAITFRQKLDGPGEEWIDGSARKVEYYGKTEVVELQIDAKVRLTSYGRLKEEASGERIIYRQRQETYAITQLPDIKSTGDRRGTLILQPAPSIDPQAASTDGAR